MSREPLIRGRTVVVTGSASGLGAALAIEAAKRGARRIALIDIDETGALAVSKEIEMQGSVAEVHSCDLTDVAAVQRIARDVVTRHGAPGLVCANAGVAAKFGPGIETPITDVQWVLSVNVLGTIATIAAFGQAMAASASRCWYLVTGSEHSLAAPHTGMASYTASKHALLGYCDVLRSELPDHVGISIVCPGLLATRLWEAGRHRGDEFGGASEGDQLAASLMARGAEPASIAARALTGVESGRFQIFTHRGAGELLEARYKLIREDVAASLDDALSS